MKLNFSNAIIFIICFALGITISIQVKGRNAHTEIVTINTLRQMNNEISNLRAQNEFLQSEIEDIKERVIEYEDEINDTGDIRKIIRRDLDLVQIIAGTKDLEGPGIIVTLNDSKWELKEFQDPNQLIIHDADILMVINDIKGAGAEAISVNEQRILATTEITCAGPTIQVNGIKYAPPFVIKAIGDPETLSASILAPYSNAKVLEAYGLDVKIDIVDNVKVPRYRGAFDFKHIKTLGDGE